MIMTEFDMSVGKRSSSDSMPKTMHSVPSRSRVSVLSGGDERTKDCEWVSGGGGGGRKEGSRQLVKWPMQWQEIQNGGRLCLLMRNSSVWGKGNKGAVKELKLHVEKNV